MFRSGGWKEGAVLMLPNLGTLNIRTLICQNMFRKEGLSREVSVRNVKRRNKQMDVFPLIFADILNKI